MVRRAGVELMAEWWRSGSAAHVRDKAILGRDFRVQWPQDQYSLNVLASSDAWRERVTVTPHPMRYRGDYGLFQRGETEGTCLSFIPRAKCIIDHHMTGPLLRGNQNVSRVE